ncbi:hypothetical protein JXA32_06040 [Candidatus Sumerlaeota bacterium]|nr:hypothetical protein [Candidatus Sumerlaeota bacterium]
MNLFEDNTSWYHGSPEKLTALLADSWITPYKELAKAFAHKPELISMDDDCSHIKHNGRLPGFLYLVDEPVSTDDVEYLKNTAQTHWQTQRDLRLRLVAELPLDDPPQLSEEEITELRNQAPEGGTGFIGDPDEE